MIGERIDKAKSDSIELVNYVLQDSHNRIALITFSDDSQVLSDFTNNKNLLTEKINSIVATGETNYNAALKNVNEVINFVDKDYFSLESVDDIEVTTGVVKLEEENGLQKIIWNLGTNSFLTGKSARMYINLTLKDEYLNNKGFYSTNNNESIIYKLIDGTEKTVNSSKTPVLKNKYKITYDANPPEGCDIKEITEEEYFAFESVTKRTDKLSCNGYLFKGWEAVEQVKKVNDDVFLMPGNDINIKGTWTKQGIGKTMDGTVYVAPTLYNEYINLTNDTNYPYKFDNSTNTLISTNKTNSKTGTVSFSVATPGEYIINYLVSSQANRDYAYFYKDGTEIGKYSGLKSGSISLGTIDSSNVIMVMYTKDNGKYKLNEDNSKKIWDLKVDYNEINNMHSTCFNETGECETLSYVYYYNSYSSGYNIYYINQKEEKSVEDILSEMLRSDNVNDKNSVIKDKIDTWYQANMTEYTDRLEDTTFCNDRSVSELNGWDPNGGSIKSYLYFGANGRNSTLTYDLTCKNKSDSFTMSNSIANGKLKYPVGLLTRDEAGLISPTKTWYIL